MSQSLLPDISGQPGVPTLIKEVGSDSVAENKFWIEQDGLSSTVGIARDKLRVLDGPMKNPPVFLPPSRLSLGNSSSLIYPSKSLNKSSLTYTITCLDVSPDQQLLAVGDINGAVNILSPTENGILRRKLGGHLIYTSVVRFFPSGQVIASAGSDMQVKIWSAIDGSNPRTLTGHKAPITALELIGHGRNVISGSSDGKVIVWECGSGKQVSQITEHHSIVGISTLHSTSTSNTVSPNSIQNDIALYEADGKSLLVATPSSVAIYDLRTSATISSIPSPSPITSIASLDNQIAIGYTSGLAEVYDLKNHSSPASTLAKKESSRSAIQSLAFKSPTELTILDMSSVFTKNFSTESIDFYIQDVTPLVIKQSSNHLYTGGKLGDLHMY